MSVSAETAARIADYVYGVEAARREASPLLSCSISKKTIRATEARLYALPELCERAITESGAEAAVLAIEIDMLKQALAYISTDPYYPLVPAKYFSRAKERTAAAIVSCDKATVWRNRTRLLNTLAVRLYGVAAWETTNSL